MTASPTPAQPAVPRTTRWSSRVPIRLAAFMPLWVFLLTFAVPKYFGPMFDAQPDFYGITLGTALFGLAMGWMLIGVGLIWNARPIWVELLVLAFFTLPATFLVVMGPAAVLIIQNLG